MLSSTLTLSRINRKGGGEKRRKYKLLFTDSSSLQIDLGLILQLETKIFNLFSCKDRPHRSTPTPNPSPLQINVLPSRFRSTSHRKHKLTWIGSSDLPVYLKGFGKLGRTVSVLPSLSYRKEFRLHYLKRVYPICRVGFDMCRSLDISNPSLGWSRQTI